MQTALSQTRLTSSITWNHVQYVYFLFLMFFLRQGSKPTGWIPIVFVAIIIFIIYLQFTSLGGCTTAVSDSDRESDFCSNM